MIQTIWKFPLETTDEQVIELPVGAKILTVQLQGGKPCLWALVNPDQTMQQVKIETFETGHNIPSGNRTYIATYQLMAGSLILHAFYSNP